MSELGEGIRSSSVSAVIALMRARGVEGGVAASAEAPKDWADVDFSTCGRMGRALLNLPLRAAAVVPGCFCGERLRFESQSIAACFDDASSGFDRIGEEGGRLVMLKGWKNSCECPSLQSITNEINQSQTQVKNPRLFSDPEFVLGLCCVNESFRRCGSNPSNAKTKKKHYRPAARGYLSSDLGLSGEET